jgi:hypothetical protein
MEAKMRVLTINELLRMTRKELCDLAAHITALLPTYREGSAARTAAFINLRNIRWALTRRDPSPQIAQSPAGSRRQGQLLLLSGA